MIIVAIFLYYGFFGFLYHIILKMKGEPVLWRCACSLLSILSLLAALHLSIPDFNLEILMQRYKWYFRCYFSFTIVFFYLGGWQKSKKISDVAKQKNFRSHLFKSFIGLLIYLAFEFNLISF